MEASLVNKGAGIVSNCKGSDFDICLDNCEKN